jgi:hypothetical protein
LSQEASVRGGCALSLSKGQAVRLDGLSAHE